MTRVYMGLMDLSQVELRAAAWLHGDTKLAQALRETDPHAAIASRLFRKEAEDVTGQERKKSKGVTFGSLYLGGAAGIANKSGFSKREITDAQERFWGEYTILKEGFNRSIRRGLSDKVVRGFTGRERDIANLIKAEGDRGAARKIVNTPIQQLASDILLAIAEVILNGLLRLASVPCITIHDAILVDIHPHEVKKVIKLFRLAFKRLAVDPLFTELPLWGELPVQGELVIADSWAKCESTHADYSPRKVVELSTQ